MRSLQVSACLILLGGLSQCGLPGFEFVDLEKADYEYITLAKGTELRALSFSGGKKCDKLSNYAPQLIALTPAGDTVRIVAPCQDYKGESQVVYFIPWSEGDHKRLLAPTEVAENGNRFKAELKTYVCYNESMASLESRSYPTAIGSFSTSPLPQER